MGGIVQRKAKDPYEGFEVFKKYKFTSIKLGVSETAQVHEAEKDDELYAVKITVKSEAHLIGRSHQDLLREAEIMGKIRHPNACRLIEKFEDNDLLFFVLEYCEGGSLFEKLENDAVLEEHLAKPMVKDMFSAVSYLHDKGYIHRDLRPENWLLSDLTDEAKLKLTHFRLCKECAKDTLLSQPCGTLHYVAPEVLRGHYSRPSDVWTLGVLMFLVLYGNYPFDGDNSAFVMTAILSSEADWSDSCYALSQDAKDLLKKLLIKDPDERLTLLEGSRHPWLPPRGSRLERPSIASLFSGVHGVGHQRKSTSRSTTMDTVLSRSASRGPLSKSSSIALKGGPDGKRRVSTLVTKDLIKNAGEGKVEYDKVALAQELASASSFCSSDSTLPEESQEAIQGKSGQEAIQDLTKALQGRHMP